MSASSMLFKVIIFCGQGESRANEPMNPWVGVASTSANLCRKKRCV